MQDDTGVDTGATAQRKPRGEGTPETTSTGHGTPLTIAILGAGAGGTLLAVQLARQAREPVRVLLIERAAQVGAGLAYGVGSDVYLLNVPAGRISALQNDPDHFARWLHEQALATRERGEPPGPQDFVPRAWYGAYLRWMLADAYAQASDGVHVERVADTAVEIDMRSGPPQVRLASGATLHADAVVLALGNGAPSDPLPPALVEAAGTRYFRDPWAPTTLATLAQLPADATVLCIGSGLTMVDMAVTLSEQGHRGPLIAVSRRGLLPTTHAAPPQAPIPFAPLLNGEALTARRLMRAFRHAVRDAQARDYDWRRAIDGVRPQTQLLWQALPLHERARALRHAMPYWEVHRHRMAPAIGRRIDAMRQRGQLSVRAGNICGLLAEDGKLTVSIRPRGSTQAQPVRADILVNCTGSAIDLARSSDPLLNSLARAGLVRADALGLGLDVTLEGALYDATGSASTTLWTLGPPRRGALWETTALPEIRTQAAELARTLLSARR